MKRVIFIIFVVSIFSVTYTAQGTHYYVDAVNGSNSNSGTSWSDAWKTITYALTQATGSSADPGIIHIAAGTYNQSLGESFPLNMKSWVHFDGVNKYSVVIDGSGSNASAIDYSNSDYDVIVQDLTVTGGASYNYGGGIDIYRASMTVYNCLITGNAATNDGGGIACRWESNLNIINCQITNNVASDDGGGVYIYNASSLTMDNCQVNNNEGVGMYSAGGGVCINGSCTGTISNSQMNNNIAKDGGGFDCTLSASVATLTNCQINGNQAYNGGGLRFIGTGTITNCEISNNYAGTMGGGLECITSGKITVNSCTFDNNTAAEWGGGLRLGGVYTGINNTKISNNPSDLGGGIWAADTSLGISGCTFTNNSTVESGGGCYLLDFSATAVINHCVFYGNSSS